MNPFEQAFRAYTSRQGGNMHGRRTIRQQTFCYATFPIKVDIQPSDILTGGIALHLQGTEGVLSAFALREVCFNGMVAPYVFQEIFHPLNEVEELPSRMEEILNWMRIKGIRQVANRYRRVMRRPISVAFWDRLGVRLMRLSSRNDLLADIQWEAKQESQRRSAYARLLKGRWEGAADSLSLFDAINGITAVARTHPEPDISWQLQQLAWSLLFSQPNTDPTKLEASEAQPALDLNRYAL